MQRLRIDLFPSIDKDKQKIFVGRLEFPGNISLRKGAAFLIYLEPDQEELHICPLTSPDISNVFDYYQEQEPRASRSKHGKLSIPLESRFSEDKKFYIGKLKVDATIDCSNGVVFLAFLADENEEELQIGIIKAEKMSKNKFEPGRNNT